jgi:hypothetical protein
MVKFQLYIILEVLVIDKVLMHDGVIVKLFISMWDIIRIEYAQMV